MKSHQRTFLIIVGVSFMILFGAIEKGAILKMWLSGFAMVWGLSWFVYSYFLKKDHKKNT